MTVADTSLQQRLDEVGNVLTSGDADRTAELYTSDGQLLPPGNDLVTGREAVADFWRGVVDSGVETIDIEPLDVDVHGDSAVRVGQATLSDAGGGTVDDVKFIEVWKRDEGEWRIHRDIWNSNVGEE